MLLLRCVLKVRGRGVQEAYRETLVLGGYQNRQLESEASMLLRRPTHNPIHRGCLSRRIGGGLGPYDAAPLPSSKTYQPPKKWSMKQGSMTRDPLPIATRPRRQHRLLVRLNEATDPRRRRDQTKTEPDSADRVYQQSNLMRFNVIATPVDTPKVVDTQMFRNR